MSVGGALRYTVGVGIVGRALLRYERVRKEMKMRRRGWWKHESLSPPLSVSPWLKELISKHYLAGRYANGYRKVAWVTSGAPVEPLIALGFLPIYPENHAAVCGIRRVAEEYCIVAEEAGYSPDLCSYARTDIGAALSGLTPVGRLPRPDLLVACTNICQTVLLWYRVLADHFGVPLVVIDTPFIYERATEHMLRYVERQIEASIEVAERVAGRSLAPADLHRVTRLSRDACELWREVMARGRARPAPITAFDEFIHMAPIVEMRGEAFTVDYYAAMLAELDQRVERGVGAVIDERKRLIWDNLPIWPKLRYMSELLASHGVALVASTYTNAWGELADMIDPDNPIGSAAKIYTHPILNQGTGHKLATIRDMVEEFSADGVILHSDRSCKPYSVGQMDQRDRLGNDVGVPALLLEADHNDPRSFSEEQSNTRITAFLEMIGA